MSMAMNRGIELIFESTPQTCFQTFRIIKSTAANETISNMQYATVITSFLAIGFIFTIMDYEVDTSDNYRKKEPELYGCIPSSKAKRAIFTFALMLHVTAYAAMRTIASATLFKAPVFLLCGCPSFCLIYRNKNLPENIQLLWSRASFLNHIMNIYFFCCNYRRWACCTNSIHGHWARIHMLLVGTSMRLLCFRVHAHYLCNFRGSLCRFFVRQAYARALLYFVMANKIEVDSEKV